MEPNGFVQSLKNAIDRDSLFTIRSLNSPFSAYAAASYLSYAQSYTIVEYLITEYGQDKMLQLLNRYKEGTTYDRALKDVYGFDTDGLNTLWQEYVVNQY